MATYLLERNKKLYYRRRIPTQLTKYFSNMSEIRLQVSQKSYFQATMCIDVINGLHSPLNVIAKLQYETGLRVSEAYTVIGDLEKHLNNLKLHNVQGKGGQIYNEKIISLELKIMLLKLKTEQMKIPHQSTYYRHLQRYGMSSHDLRAFYTKELYESKMQNGFTHKEACEFVSKEINHHRIQITEYYLAKFA